MLRTERVLGQVSVLLVPSERLTGWVKQALYNNISEQGMLVVLKCVPTLKEKGVVVREGFLEEVRFQLWSWLAPGPVCPVQHPVLEGRPHRNVLSVRDPGHVLGLEKGSWVEEERSIHGQSLEELGIPQIFTCSRPPQPSREETGRTLALAISWPCSA